MEFNEMKSPSFIWSLSIRRAAAQDIAAHARVLDDARVPGLCRLCPGGSCPGAAGRAHHALRQLVQLPGALLLHAPSRPPGASVPGDWQRFCQGKSPNLYKYLKFGGEMISEAMVAE